jgi:alpha-tubulin suppressor-like RCC1 family protein
MPTGVTFTELSAGADFSLALDSGGHVWAWGADSESIFVSDTPVPAPLPQRIRFQAITVGTDDNATALSQKGIPWSWAGVDGLSTKVAMPTGLAFTEVANGDFHTVALTADGAAWAWGYNRYGQLGNRSEVGSSVPVPVSMPAGVPFTTISAGQDSSFAVGSNGVAYAWGDNSRGEVGTGSDMHSYHRPVPVQMPGGISFAAISSKDFAVGALATDGSAWYWGNCSNVPAATPMPPGVQFVTLASAAHVLYVS